MGKNFLSIFTSFGHFRKNYLENATLQIFKSFFSRYSNKVAIRESTFS